MHVNTKAEPRDRGADERQKAVRAIVVEQYGGPDVLKVKDVVLARPRAGQALVRLAMAGVNFVDIY
jgi:NADPH:quinone reductase